MIDYRNLAVFLLILALFLGATVEISEGLIPIGVILFIIAVILISKIEIKGGKVKQSKYRLILGVSVVMAVIVYNIKTNSTLGTLDMMTTLFGISLIAQDLNKEDIRKMGLFGMYMSGVFIILFLIFFSMFNRFNIDLIHQFDHHFVLLPTVFIIKAAGIPIHVIGTETVYIQGVEEMSVIIGGPCSGLYSMFLLIATVIAYSRMERVERKKVMLLLAIAVLVAYIANLTRVVILYIVGFFYGVDTMMLVHVHLGWIIFIVVMFILLSIIKRFERFVD
ncbi:archaeosortase C [Archaeoglobales archaeon]|nr:MAG: archaeosortase C [Archaeoglobales archaeon]